MTSFANFIIAVPPIELNWVEFGVA